MALIFFEVHFLLTLHQKIFARFRLPAIFGGNPNTTFDVEIMNDTGSNIQTLFPTDLVALGYDRLTYRGHRGVIDVRTANGTMRRRVIVIEVQITKADGMAITPWFRQNAIVLRLQSGIQYRLSG